MRNGANGPKRCGIIKPDFDIFIFRDRKGVFWKRGLFKNVKFLGIRVLESSESVAKGRIRLVSRYSRELRDYRDSRGCLNDGSAMTSSASMLSLEASMGPAPAVRHMN